MEFKEVLKKDKHHAEAATELATIFGLQKKYDKAQKYFEYVLKIEPNNITANLRYGKILQTHLKQHNEAIECYNRAIAADPSNFKGYYQLALCYLDLKDYTNAHENLKTCLKLNQKYAPAWKAIGTVFFDNNKPDKAIRYFQQALTLDPNDLASKINLASCYYDLQNHEGAIKLYLEILQTESSADNHYNLANTYYMKQDLPEAIKHYNKAIEMNPNRADYFYNLGNSYCMNGDYNKAIDSFQKSIKLDSTNIAALYNLGNAYLLINDFQNAIKSFEGSLKLEPENTEWRVMLANLYIEINDLKAGQTHLDLVLAKDSNNLEAIMTQGKYFELQGDKAKALELFKQVKEAQPNFEGIDEKLATLQE